jgi:hypothetical protein
MFGIFPEIDIENFLKIANAKLKQPIIFKVKIEYLLFLYSRGDQIFYFLITKPGLTRSPHTDDDIRLTLYFRKFLIPSYQFRQFPFMEIVNKLRNYIFHNGHAITFLETIQAIYISILEINRRGGVSRRSFPYYQAGRLASYQANMD